MNSSPQPDYRALAGELARFTEFALRESNCDGDLCMWAWHEQARELLSRPEVKVLLDGETGTEGQ